MSYIDEKQTAVLKFDDGWSKKIVCDGAGCKADDSKMTVFYSWYHFTKVGGWTHVHDVGVFCPSCRPLIKD